VLALREIPVYGEHEFVNLFPEELTKRFDVFRTPNDPTVDVLENSSLVVFLQCNTEIDLERFLLLKASVLLLLYD
jgi:hypothetical protein